MNSIKISAFTSLIPFLTLYLTPPILFAEESSPAELQLNNSNEIRPPKTAQDAHFKSNNSSNLEQRTQDIDSNSYAKLKTYRKNRRFRASREDTYHRSIR